MLDDELHEYKLVRIGPTPQNKDTDEQIQLYVDGEFKMLYFSWM